jgi:hypothetical protein
MTKSKFFRAFVEGSTVSDGRKITREMIDQIAETFSTDAYTPRINIEHLKGYSPEPPFNGYGSVIAVKAQDDEITIAGEKKTVRALYAQVDGNDQLVKLRKPGTDQKPFPSVELTDSYAGSGKVGMIGLAFTDTPASLGTQALQFSRSTPGSVFAAGDEAVELEFEDVTADQAGFLRSVKGMMDAFSARFAKPEEPKVETPPAAPAGFDMAAFSREVGTLITGAIGAYATANDAALAALRTDFTNLKTQLETTEDKSFRRSPASGGEGRILTDC